jgi:hypothetical protein
VRADGRACGEKSAEDVNALNQSCAYRVKNRTGSLLAEVSVAAQKICANSS